MRSWSPPTVTLALARTGRRDPGRRSLFNSSEGDSRLSSRGFSTVRNRIPLDSLLTFRNKLHEGQPLKRNLNSPRLVGTDEPYDDVCLVRADLYSYSLQGFNGLDYLYVISDRLQDHLLSCWLSSSVLLHVRVL